MSALTFKISAQLEAAGFKQAADYMKTLANETQKAKDSTAEHGSKVDLLKAAYSGLVGLGIVEFFKSAYEEAAQAREQEILLSNRVEQTGLSYEKAKPKLDAFFEALQNQSGIARDRLIPAFNELIDKTQSVNASQQLLATAMGLARAKGMDLAAASEMVGGAYNGETRALQQLGRTMGMTKTEAQDNEKVMAKAKETYEKYATSVDGSALALSRLQNSYKDFKEKVGSGTSGLVAFGANFLTSFLANLEAGLEANAVHFAKWIGIVKINMSLFTKLWGDGWLKATEEARTQLNILGKISDEELGKIGDKLRQTLNPNGDPLKKLFEGTTEEFEKMNASMEILLAEGVLATKRTDYGKLVATTELIDAQNEAFREQLHNQAEWGRLSAEDQQALDTAIVQKGIADKTKAWQQYAAKTTALGIQVGTSLGQSMGMALNGQEDAWAGMMRTVIDVIVQGAQAYLAAWTASKVAVQLESEDYAGAAKTAAIGGLYAGIISAGGEVAKSQIKGGSSSSSSSSGGGGGGGTISAQGAPAAAPAASNNSVTVYVYGDVVDSDAFMNSLAAKLSDNVQNKDIKLVASSVTP